MKKLSSPTLYAVSALAGLVLGYIGGPAIILIIWAATVLTLVAMALTRKEAVISGAIFGFVVSYIFMISSYDGKTPVSTKLLPFVLFGIFGAVCGSILATLGKRAHHLK